MKTIVCIALLCGFGAVAQETDQINGAITDPSGANVPGVEITVTQTETGLKRTALSDSRGLYLIPNLPLGPYNLQATKMGFQKFVWPGIVLQVGTN